jgi:ribosomal protein S18 acetylase RimI-like enzyme
VTLLNAVASNHRAWFRRTAALSGGAVERIGGIDLVVDGRSGTIPFPRSRAPGSVAAVMRRARELGVHSMGCWSLRADRVLGTVLFARGWEWGWQPHWMGIDLAQLRDEEPAHDVVPAAGSYAARVPYARSAPYPKAARHLAVRRNNEIVGHVVINPWRRTAGIYDMGVAPAERRRGIGRALTVAACRLARELGCTHAILNATPEGELVYGGIGFESLGHGQTWWLHPGRPTPTARQTELAEAIGFGSLRALETLRPTRAELEKPLSSDTTPLALTIVTGQVEVARWLLERRPDLVSAPLDRGGSTLLHLAVFYDDEDIVRLALAHGADREARDRQWESTPLGWAEHLGRVRLAALLLRDLG